MDLTNKPTYIQLDDITPQLPTLLGVLTLHFPLRTTLHVTPSETKNY